MYITVTLPALYLQVHSENCVVFMLSAWAKSDAHPACSPQRMKELACGVRVQHLSPLYLLCVLPDLIWFKDAGVVMALRSLALKSALGTIPGLQFLPCSSFPAAWKAAKRINISLPESAVLTWDLGPQELGDLEAAAPRTQGQQPDLLTRMLSPGSVYLDGIAYQLSVGKYTDPQNAAKVTFGMVLAVDYVVMKTVTGSLSPDQQQLPLRYLAELSAGSNRHTLNTISLSPVGLCDYLGQSGSTLAEVVAPHLVEGRLTLKAVIKSG